MSTYYLFDMHSNPITDSRLRGVILDPDGTTAIDRTGSFVVRVPPGVQIDTEPTNLTELLTEKYAGLLASFAGFTRITFDDLLDATNLNAAASSQASFGDRSNIIAFSNGAIIESDPTALSGGAPTEAIVTWEAFQSVSAGSLGVRQVLQYQEVAADDFLQVDVSFNGGTDFNTVTNSGLLAIPPAEVGTSFVIRFTSQALGLANVQISSWSVIY